MSKKTVLFRLPNKTIAYLEVNSVDQILKDKGLDPSGDAQRFHTANVLKRIKRYMPNLSGMTYKVTVVQTDITKPRIITNTPYAKYLFYGKKMVNAKTGKGPRMIPGIGPRYAKGTVLKVTGEDLKYTKKNPNAGPRWGRTLSAAEGRAMAEDLTRYIAFRR
jgi:hypothetical protein